MRQRASRQEAMDAFLEIKQKSHNFQLVFTDLDLFPGVHPDRPLYEEMAKSFDSLCEYLQGTDGRKIICAVDFLEQIKIYNPSDRIALHVLPCLLTILARPDIDAETFASVAGFVSNQAEHLHENEIDSISYIVASRLLKEDRGRDPVPQLGNWVVEMDLSQDPDIRVELYAILCFLREPEVSPRADEALRMLFGGSKSSIDMDYVRSIKAILN